MSQLQSGLLAIGALVLLALVLHYLWLARKHRPHQTSDDPVSMGDSAHSQEPHMGLNAFEDTGFALPVPEKKPTLDALIDVIAPVSLDAPVSGESVLAAMPPTRRVGSKPFTVEGFNTQGQQWEFPLAGQRYSQLQAGIQLANRSGALNDIEYSEFVIKTQAFCDTLSGTPDFPDMRQEVARARELDQFASDHDAQLSFVLRARRAAWSPSYIQQMAAKYGFVPGVIPGRMVVPAALPGLPPVLTLTFDVQAAMSDDPTQTALRELNLSLDVSQVERGERAFERMRQAASQMATEMDGAITDDNGVALPSEAMDVIATELEVLHDTLAQRELSAGSALARRLFS